MGVNDHVDGDDVAPPTLSIDPAVEDRQLARLRQVKADRDDDRVRVVVTDLGAVPALTECLFESRDRYAKEQVVEELQRTPLLLEQIEALDGTHAGDRLKADIEAVYAKRPPLAMVNFPVEADSATVATVAAEVPIVMVTTEFDPKKLAEIYQLGVSAICNKSFERELVRNIVIQLFA